jgi:CheY-like chemotaxis protein
MPYTILIVDDSATTRALIRRTIKLAEVPVEHLYEAANGKLALELLDCVHVDLVLADLNMPEMNGFEMTRQMLANPSTHDVPVVLVSAEPNAEAFAQTHPQIRGCLQKPFTPEGIRNVIFNTLGVAHA